MKLPAYYPYRSEAARAECFAYFDALAARQWPVPAEERTVATSYGPTFVRVGGPAGAPPLVLLPGAAATSLVWSPNIRELSRECRTFAVDQVGEFGKTLCRRPIRSFDDLVGWLNELFDGLELTDVNLAGVSYGGALTAQYALRCPERLNKAVLVAPALTVLRAPMEFWVRIVWASIAGKKGLPAFVRWIFADMARQDPASIQATLEQLFLGMRSLQPRRAPIPPVLGDAEWDSLRVPTLFLAGEHEKVYSAGKAAQRLRRVAAAVTPEIIPGAGHDLTFVQADLVSRRILEFLRTTPSRRSEERSHARTSTETELHSSSSS
jgi:pimeloyl-ACP methyl ester carboxylesterase